MHNRRTPPTIPPSYIQVHTVVWECGEEQIDRHTDRQTQMAVTTIHFASSMTHVKCNDNNYYCYQYTGQLALFGTSSSEMEDFVAAQLPACSN